LSLLVVVEEEMPSTRLAGTAVVVVQVAMWSRPQHLLQQVPSQK